MTESEPKFVVISGPSGVGKTTICKRLIEANHKVKCVEVVMGAEQASLSRETLYLPVAHLRDARLKKLVTIVSGYLQVKQDAGRI